MADIVSYFLNYEPIIRAVVFGSVMAAMMAWEWRTPWRPPRISRWLRWTGNLGVVVVSTALARAMIPIMPVVAAGVAAQNGWGLFNVIKIPTWSAAIAGFLILDIVIYAQHRAFHMIPVLWRLHRMHHADTEIDATTGLRFHPVEIILSFIIKIGMVFAFGIGPVTVLVFEIVLNAISLFNHTNVKLSDSLDATLRLLVVTPDMHRVHHSVVRSETDSNFAFNFSWWDRLFGTYRAAPGGGLEEMTTGLPVFRADEEQRLDKILLQPFGPERP